MKIQLQNITQFCLPEGQQNLLQIAVAEKNDQQEEVSIYQINPIDTLQPFEKLASVPLDLGVNIMTWKEHPKYLQGVLVIGTKDGCLIGIDVKKFKEEFENEQESFYVFSLQIYEQGSIQSLQYNFFKEDLLAVGDKELYIINFQNSFESPDIFCPFQISAPANRICSIGWNKVKTVQHILACAQDNGKISIIDLKVKKSIFNFSDGKENLLQREVCLTWYQNSPTQLAVGFDNEDSGVQIWDLKHAKGPIKKIPGLGSVIKIEWKVDQRNVILCANRQGKLILYGYENDCILHQFNLKGESLLCAFVPNCEETYAVLSSEKELNILTQNQQQLNEKALLTNSKQKQEDFICSILPSGKVMSCQSTKQNGQNEKDFQQSVFEIFSENDEGLSIKLEVLNKLLSNKNTEENYQLLKEYMEHDHELLMLINHLDQNPQNKQQILCIKEEEILQRTEALTGEQYQSTQKPQNKLNTNLLQEAQENDAQDFFSNLGAQNSSQNEAEQVANDNEKIITKTLQYNQDWNQGTELLIKQNIFIGNLQGAIDLCLKTHRITEALLIAKSHATESQKLIEKIIQNLTAQNQEEFVNRFIVPYSQKNYQAILENFQTKSWKETLYFIINSIKNSETQKQLQNKFIQNLKENNETEILQKVQLFLNNHNEFKEGLICSILSKQNLLEQIDQFILYVFYSLKTKEKAKGKMGQILL